MDLGGGGELPKPRADTGRLAGRLAGWMRHLTKTQQEAKCYPPLVPPLFPPLPLFTCDHVAAPTLSSPWSRNPASVLPPLYPPRPPPPRTCDHVAAHPGHCQHIVRKGVLSHLLEAAGGTVKAVSQHLLFFLGGGTAAAVGSSNSSSSSKCECRLLRCINTAPAGRAARRLLPPCSVCAHGHVAHRKPNANVMLPHCCC